MAFTYGALRRDTIAICGIVAVAVPVKEQGDGLRVLLLSDADVFAGTERHMFDLANGLKVEGVEAWIGSPTPSALRDRAESVGIRHIVVQKGGLIDRPAISVLTQLLKSNQIDLIHSHNGRTMLSAAMAVTLARKGVAVATQHFLEPDHATRSGPKAILYHAAHRWVSGRLSCYIAISESVRDAMLQRNEAPSDRIAVVQNGMPPIDPAMLLQPAEVRRAFNVPASQLLIVCAARLEKEKDIATLIAAVADAKRTQPGITCLVAGAGSLEGELNQQIAKLELQDTVKLLGFRTDVLSLIAACDLFILPSVAEPFGLVLLEAMALGKPVITTDAGGPREIVVNGSTGFLVAPTNAAALANAIRVLAEDQAMRDAMGARGHDRFQERFTAQKMSQSMLAIYRHVLHPGVTAKESLVE